ncbi:MAG: AAA family ATPase [Bacteroidetes bacterium]|nr:AAA family ATPase [Bacteroidota bacterium]
MNDAINNLREALKISPDNMPLRMLLAETLMNHFQYADAEEEYKSALTIAPSDVKIKLGLATACYRQQKFSIAGVIVEELLHTPAPPPFTYVLHAHLLIKENKIMLASEEYRKALSLDASLHDDDLEEALKVRNTAGEEIVSEEDFDDSINSIERPKINFDDVGGMQKVKEEINIKIILPLQHPELYKAYGKSIGGGILLYGPPGCGKTLLARATAGQVKSSFITVGISDILDMYIGSSEQRLHQMFEMARDQTPCVLFFDEVDALGASRSDMRHSAGRHLINQFLNEMDGAVNSNDGILILGATNAPWHLDAAFRRPGRFDRILFVPPPDDIAREEILKVMLQGKPISDIDYNAIAKKTKEFSGADLKAIVDMTIEDKLRESFTKGIPSPIGTNDLLKVLKQINPSTKEWFVSARNYALYANESGLYNEILEYLGIKK